MFGRLLPKEGRFFDLFNQHAEQIVRAAHELAALMQDYAERERHARIIDEAEHAADHVTAETVRLPDIAVKCCERVKDVVRMLGEEKTSAEVITKTCEEIDRLES